MQFDARNMMVGEAPHIRAAGPHNHVWETVGSDSTAAYRECAICGARSCDMAVNDWHLAGRADWLVGGPWEAHAPAEDAPEPPTAEQNPAPAEPDPAAAAPAPKGKAAPAGEA